MSAKQWLDAIKQAEKDQKDWVLRSEKIIKRYRDERESNQQGKQFNMLWSNTQTLKPALFSQNPIPYVERRFKDADPVSRQASEVLERAVSYTLDNHDFYGEVSSAVEDRLLPGRGVVRVLYEPTIETDEFENEIVTYEEAKIQYIYWKDFLILGKARRWPEVNACAIRCYMDRDELIERFGHEIGSKIELDHKPEGDKDGHPDDYGKKATIYEIWDKKQRKVHWLAKSWNSDLLDSGEPPLNLVDFWPFPRPIFATTTNGTLIPVPDYVQYQDQADEIDDLTARIDKLTVALKVVGIYAADAIEIADMMSESRENTLIPVENWAAIAERGGVDGLISWLPLEQVLKVLMGLYEARESAKQVIYEITGLSDLVRGQSVASETATAQRIKGQFASLRLNDMQGDVSRFVRDIVRLIAEVIADQFDGQTLSLMSNQPVSEDVMSLLRNDLLRGFRIDIETDSTVKVDEQAEKDSRIEFLGAVSSFIEKAIVAGQQQPALTPLLGQMLLFGVRGFKVGRQLEGQIEETLDQLSNMPAEPEQPDPQAEKDKAEFQLKAAQAKNDQINKERELTQKDRELDQQAVSLIQQNTGM